MRKLRDKLAVLMMIFSALLLGGCVATLPSTAQTNTQISTAATQRAQLATDLLALQNVFSAEEEKNLQALVLQSEQTSSDIQAILSMPLLPPVQQLQAHQAVAVTLVAEADKLIQAHQDQIPINIKLTWTRYRASLRTLNAHLQAYAANPNAAKQQQALQAALQVVGAATGLRPLLGMPL